MNSHPHRPHARGRGSLGLARATGVAALVLAVALPASSAAGAAGPGREAPPAAAASDVAAGRWAVVAGPSGPELVWSAPSRLPFGNARIDIHVGGSRYGQARVARDGRSVSVPVPPGTSLRDLPDPQVVAAGRRLDVRTPLDPGAPAADLPQRALPERAAAALPALPSTLDPGRPGPYPTRTDSYSLLGLRIAGIPAPVEVEGVVVAPEGARGPRPLVLFLHGRHATCYQGGPAGEATGEWPCPAGWTSIPSYRGYLQAQRLLASQGYLTVSIGANGINGQDFALEDGGAAARSALVRHHLTLWARWSTAAGRASAPPVVRSSPLPDLSRVLLVGHSRGGEGVNRAALDTVAPTGTRPVPWRIAGLVHLAPTAFGQNPAPGVPVSVLLPYCDGDVSDLQGQAYVDEARDLGPDRALRSSALVLGANHNYFNAEWTPGEAVAPANDDWYEDRDPVCGTVKGSQRLTAAQQRAVGATYVAAAVRVFVARDARVLPLLDGSRVRAASAGPARVLTHALGGQRQRVVSAGTTGADAGPVVKASGTLRGGLCLGLVAGSGLTCQRTAPSPGVHPHFVPFSYLAPGEPTKRAAWARWTRPAGQLTVAGRAPSSLRGSSALALRVVVPPASAGVRFSVRATDARGRTADLGQVTLSGMPRSADRAVYWAQEVRLPLARAARSLDLARISRLTLVPRSRSGHVLLLDAWGWRSGRETGTALRLPRLDVGRLDVVEGNSGTRTIRVPIRVSGPAGPALRKVWVAVGDPKPDGKARSFVTTLARGQRSLTIPVTVSGDRRDDRDVTLHPVEVKPVTGLTAGNYRGGAQVRDDDPTPVLTTTPVATDVVEGAPLRWRFTLSEASNLDVFVVLTPTAPAGGASELSTDDVPAAWLEEWGIEAPDAPVALSRSDLLVYPVIPAGSRSVELTVPTLADTRAEGAETLTLQALDFEQQPQLPPGSLLTGTVRDPG